MQGRVHEHPRVVQGPPEQRRLPVVPDQHRHDRGHDRGLPAGSREHAGRLRLKALAGQRLRCGNGEAELREPVTQVARVGEHALEQRRPLL